ncbi:MAG TPA: PEP-CTERM sorting domain-containing protein [Candidatus Acidoferrum sp.]|nr:PEP-CTERM sorting domain-containing protein [Candidatus Acidoferrum sp.]
MKTYLLVIPTILLLSALAAPGQGTMVYDQQSATNRSFYAGYPFQAEQPAGQSFTPALNTVGFVQFEFIAPSPGAGLGATVFVNLRSDSLTGTILDSTAPVFMPNGFNGITNFLFSAPVAVTSGITYYLQPVLQSGDSSWGLVAGPFNYLGGTFFFNGAPNPDAFNAWFREGTFVPEPASGLLMLLGAASLFFTRRLGRSCCLVSLVVGGSLAVCTTRADTAQTAAAPSYYSAQHPEWPPVPTPTPGCAAAPIHGRPGDWLMADQTYDYAVSDVALSIASPMGLTPNGPSPLDHGTALWLEIEQPVSGNVPVTAHNVDGSQWFQLLSTTNIMAHPDWSVEEQVQQPASTDLPLIVPENGRPNVSFRAAQSDTLMSVSSVGNVLRPNDCYSSQPSYFNIQRSYASSGSYPPLQVWYCVGGTATNGVDYTYLDGSATLPSGASSYQIKVDALPSLVTSNLTLVLTLVATNGYLVDSNGPSATMIIGANRFGAVAELDWQANGLDYDPQSQSLVVSEETQYPPYHNFLRIDASGVNPWLDVSGLWEEVSLAIVKTSANGFTLGDMYFDSSSWPNNQPTNPRIGWASGGNVVPDWVTLPPPASPLGGLYVDQTGVFGGDLIATAGGDEDASGTDGRVWRINSSGQVTLVTNTGTPLGGVITVTNDAAPWGPWAGKILTGQGQEWPWPSDPEIYAIDTNGQATTYYLGIEPEHFNFIPANQSFYCVGPDTWNRWQVWKVPASVFTGHVGDLLITGIGDPASGRLGLFMVHWDAGTTNFVIQQIAAPLGLVMDLEEGTFAPIELPCL